MKSNYHRKLSSLGYGNARERTLYHAFKIRYIHESNKRSRRMTAKEIEMELT